MATIAQSREEWGWVKTIQMLKRFTLQLQVVTHGLGGSWHLYVSLSKTNTFSLLTLRFMPTGMRNDRKGTLVTRLELDPKIVTWKLHRSAYRPRYPDSSAWQVTDLSCLNELAIWFLCFFTSDFAPQLFYLGLQLNRSQELPSMTGLFWEKHKQREKYWLQWP